MNQNTDTCQTPASSEDSPADSGEDDQQCTITFSLDASDDDPPDLDWLTDKFQQVVAALGLGAIEYSVVIVDDARMSELHAQFMDDPTTTDVLTFDLRDDPAAGPVEGEVYICLDEARRCAGERGHDTASEVLLYAVHGLLHLLGYDDHDKADHARMHAKEDELLDAVGVGRVFDRGG